MFFKVISLFFYVVLSEAGYEGDRCVKDGVAGVCTNLNRCQSAIADIRNRKNPQTCGFVGTDPIVCCLDGSSKAKPSSFAASPNKRRPVTSTEATTSEEGECEALQLSMTPKKSGQKAFDKCIEYQEQLVYPCEKSSSILGEPARSNYCSHNTDDLIIGGTDADQYEFPHMVMLGYGDNINLLEWRCGGTLISERFILTAGHCVFRQMEKVTHVVIGALRRSDAADRSKIYKVKNIIKHPHYTITAATNSTLNSKYNDIALIETEKQIKLDRYTVPACLHTGENVDDRKVLATGWGLTEDNTPDSAAEILQKVILEKFPNSICSRKYKPQLWLRHGFLPQSQMCFGDKDTPAVSNRHKDTCVGDSGGPIQIKSKNINCMYTVVGVTSFGKHCGQHPGLYTRIAPYVPWIESIVWP